MTDEERKAWEELVAMAQRENEDGDYTAILWASSRLEKLERVRKAAKEATKTHMMKYTLDAVDSITGELLSQTKGEDNCGPCDLCKALRDAEEEE